VYNSVALLIVMLRFVLSIVGVRRAAMKKRVSFLVFKEQLHG
jgi:hypothetical protein